ncbi:hypothetical protein PHYSODRAFT_489855 [Phytophthora sojae]|uniref:Uncharacterized protein n=1 Tax=Phytophthora sojae (strain P6497) TaxID=1094619 RepID=G4Z3Z3_PHYSP|nr:hypothetical protein PHYSODRAFT_489855 [Phytophthora sojae]EGZ21545.1 hypothetical protein PHYSODRAFT_489855 [Phytophthora sojae]|eukprot:XP_009524262.1 hypothetical protein PHYSODRAFT_489855 [Phytophthora sojae]
MSASLFQLGTCFTTTDHLTSEASVSKTISASGFGNARVASSARVCFIASYAAHSCSCVLQRTCESRIVYDTVSHPAWMRYESCFTPSPFITFPHHFTSRLYTQDFETLNLKPNLAVNSSISCNLSRYVSMSAAYNSKSSIQTNKCLYSGAAKHRSMVDWKYNAASTLP